MPRICASNLAKLADLAKEVAQDAFPNGCRVMCSLDIVGELYQELCETPAWDAVFGSGGRAASALAGVSRSMQLHT